MSGEPITEQKRMELAGQIADAASCLDWIGTKDTVMTDKLLGEAKAHSEKLHDIATMLAGSRVLEIYGPEEVQS